MSNPLLFDDPAKAALYTPAEKAKEVDRDDLKKKSHVNKGNSKKEFIEGLKKDYKKFGKELKSLQKTSNAGQKSKKTVLSLKSTLGSIFEEVRKSGFKKTIDAFEDAGNEKEMALNVLENVDKERAEQAKLKPIERADYDVINNSKGKMDNTLIHVSAINGIERYLAAFSKAIRDEKTFINKLIEYNKLTGDSKEDADELATADSFAFVTLIRMLRAYLYCESFFRVQFMDTNGNVTIPNSLDGSEFTAKKRGKNAECLEQWLEENLRGEGEATPEIKKFVNQVMANLDKDRFQINDTKNAMGFKGNVDLIVNRLVDVFETIIGAISDKNGATKPEYRKLDYIKRINLCGNVDYQTAVALTFMDVLESYSEGLDFISSGVAKVKATKKTLENKIYKLLEKYGGYDVEDGIKFDTEKLKEEWYTYRSLKATAENSVGLFEGIDPTAAGNINNAKNKVWKRIVGILFGNDPTADATNKTQRDGIYGYLRDAGYRIITDKTALLPYIARLDASKYKMLKILYKVHKFLDSDVKFTDALNQAFFDENPDVSMAKDRSPEEDYRKKSDQIEQQKVDLEDCVADFNDALKEFNENIFIYCQKFKEAISKLFIAPISETDMTVEDAASMITSSQKSFVWTNLGSMKYLIDMLLPFGYYGDNISFKYALGSDGVEGNQYMNGFKIIPGSADEILPLYRKKETSELVKEGANPVGILLESLPYCLYTINDQGKENFKKRIESEYEIGTNNSTDLHLPMITGIKTDYLTKDNYADWFYEKAAQREGYTSDEDDGSTDDDEKGKKKDNIDPNLTLGGEGELITTGKFGKPGSEETKSEPPKEETLEPVLNGDGKPVPNEKPPKVDKAGILDKPKVGTPTTTKNPAPTSMTPGGKDLLSKLKEKMKKNDKGNGKELPTTTKKFIKPNTTNEGKNPASPITGKAPVGKKPESPITGKAPVGKTPASSITRENPVGKKPESPITGKAPVGKTPATSITRENPVGKIPGSSITRENPVGITPVTGKTPGTKIDEKIKKGNLGTPAAKEPGDKFIDTQRNIKEGILEEKKDFIDYQRNNYKEKKPESSNDEYVVDIKQFSVDSKDNYRIGTTNMVRFIEDTMEAIDEVAAMKSNVLSSRQLARFKRLIMLEMLKLYYEKKWTKKDDDGIFESLADQFKNLTETSEQIFNSSSSDKSIYSVKLAIKNKSVNNEVYMKNFGLFFKTTLESVRDLLTRSRIDNDRARQMLDIISASSIDNKEIKEIFNEVMKKIPGKLEKSINKAYGDSLTRTGIKFLRQVENNLRRSYNECMDDLRQSLSKDKKVSLRVLDSIDDEGFIGSGTKSRRLEDDYDFERLIDVMISKVKNYRDSDYFKKSSTYDYEDRSWGSLYGTLSRMHSRFGSNIFDGLYKTFSNLKEKYNALKDSRKDGNENQAFDKIKDIKKQYSNDLLKVFRMIVDLNKSVSKGLISKLKNVDKDYLEKLEENLKVIGIEAAKDKNIRHFDALNVILSVLRNRGIHGDYKLSMKMKDAVRNVRIMIAEILKAKKGKVSSSSLRNSTLMHVIMKTIYVEFMNAYIMRNVLAHFYSLSDFNLYEMKPISNKSDDKKEIKIDKDQTASVNLLENLKDLVGSLSSSSYRTKSLDFNVADRDRYYRDSIGSLKKKIEDVLDLLKKAYDVEGVLESKKDKDKDDDKEKDEDDENVADEEDEDEDEDEDEKEKDEDEKKKKNKSEKVKVEEAPAFSSEVSINQAASMKANNTFISEAKVNVFGKDGKYHVDMTNLSNPGNMRVYLVPIVGNNVMMDKAILMNKEDQSKHNVDIDLSQYNPKDLSFHFYLCPEDKLSKPGTCVDINHFVSSITFAGFTIANKAKADYYEIGFKNKDNNEVTLKTPIRAYMNNGSALIVIENYAELGLPDASKLLLIATGPNKIDGTCNKTTFIKDNQGNLLIFIANHVLEKTTNKGTIHIYEDAQVTEKYKGLFEFDFSGEGYEADVEDNADEKITKNKKNEEKKENKEDKKDKENDEEKDEEKEEKKDEEKEEKKDKKKKKKKKKDKVKGKKKNKKYKEENDEDEDEENEDKEDGKKKKRKPIDKIKLYGENKNKSRRNYFDDDDDYDYDDVDTDIDDDDEDDDIFDNDDDGDDLILFDY